MLKDCRSKRFLTENDHAGRSTQKPTDQGAFFRTLATAATTANWYDIRPSNNPQAPRSCSPGNFSFLRGSDCKCRGVANAGACVSKMAERRFWVTTPPASATFLLERNTCEGDAGCLAILTYRREVS